MVLPFCKKHNVEYTWQANAWFDHEIVISLAEPVIIPWLHAHLRDSPDEWVVCTCHANRKVHIHPLVRACFGRAKILLWYGEPNMRHRIAPVDRSVGRTVRTVAQPEGLETWLDEKDNRKRWTRGRISAQARRELTLEWLGDAWQRIFEDGYKRMRECAWEATGSLITADGSDDDKIAPQGLPNWPGPHPPTFDVPKEWYGEADTEGDEEEGELEDLEYESSDSEAGWEEEDEEAAEEEEEEEEDEEEDEEDDDNACRSLLTGRLGAPFGDQLPAAGPSRVRV